MKTLYNFSKQVLKPTPLFKSARRFRNHVRSRQIVRQLSCGEPFKLEIGGGNHPTPGYIHLDVLDSLPSWQVDVIHDINKPFPFPDSSVSRIVTNHCVEHVSWRKLPYMLKECSRILIPGGEMVIRTPDLESIIKNYSNKTLVLENENEAQYLRDHFGGVTQSWVVVLKLFAGQDFPSNFHYAAYDFEMLQLLLLNAGFVSVEKLPETSWKDELHLLARK